MTKHFYMIMVILDLLFMGGIAVAVYHDQSVAWWGLLAVLVLWVHALYNIGKIENEIR